MDNMKLYDYSDQYQMVINYLEENEGLSFKDVKDTLDSISEAAEDKIANTGKVIQKLNDEEKILVERKAVLDNLIKKTKKNRDNLKDYLLHNMNALNKKKVQTPTITVSARNSKAMVILDESKLPEEFIKTEVKTSPKKKEFKEYYNTLTEEQQNEIKYAEVVTNQSVQVK